MFSTCVSDRAEYYCQVPQWWAQYEVLVIMFVPTPLLMAYCSVLALRHSSNHETRVCTIALSKYVFMAGAMFAISASDEDCYGYCT